MTKRTFGLTFAAVAVLSFLTAMTLGICAIWSSGELGHRLLSTGILFGVMSGVFIFIAACPAWYQR